MIRWRGIHKLNEEIGEVLRVTGKLGAFPIPGTHPSGEDLKQSLHNELADVEAAIEYFKMVNQIGGKQYSARRSQKYQLFIGWKLSGIDDGKER